ncbi:MAG: hypothetical protein ACFCBU_05920 [Cyanophyceae cyanobacterium]
MARLLRLVPLFFYFKEGIGSGRDSAEDCFGDRPEDEPTKAAYR